MMPKKSNFVVVALQFALLPQLGVRLDQSIRPAQG